MIKYIQDNKVDKKLDKKIIQLLSMCFVKEPVLNKQRYVLEMPQHRWYIEDETKLIAHIAMHDKIMSTKTAEFPYGGIAEVAVHHDYRGRGYVKQILIQIHEWLKTNHYPFALLFGEKEIYASSGYSPVNNKIKYKNVESNDWIIEVNRYALKCILDNTPWPAGLIDINGPMF